MAERWGLSAVVGPCEQRVQTVVVTACSLYYELCVVVTEEVRCRSLLTGATAAERM